MILRTRDLLPVDCIIATSVALYSCLHPSVIIALVCVRNHAHTSSLVIPQRRCRFYSSFLPLPATAQRTTAHSRPSTPMALTITSTGAFSELFVVLCSVVTIYGFRLLWILCCGRLQLLSFRSRVSSRHPVQRRITSSTVNTDSSTTIIIIIPLVPTYPPPHPHPTRRWANNVYDPITPFVYGFVWPNNLGNCLPTMGGPAIPQVRDRAASALTCVDEPARSSGGRVPWR